MEGDLLSLVLIVGGEEIVDRELRLDDLLLEVGRKFDSDLVGKRVALIELDVALQCKCAGQVADLYLEQMLVIDEVRYAVVILPPRVRYRLGGCVVHHLILPCVSAIERLFHLPLQLGRHDMVLSHPCLHVFHVSLLLFNVLLLLPQESLMCPLENLKSVLQRHPLEPRHEFIHNSRNLVAVRDGTRVDFDVVLSDETLGCHRIIFDVERPTSLSLSMWPLLRSGVVEVVRLDQSVVSHHGLLETVL